MSKTSKILNSVRRSAPKPLPMTNEYELPNYNGAEINHGYVSGKKSGVFAWLRTPQFIEAVTAGENYAIFGDFVNDPIEDFFLRVPDGIVYDGDINQHFEVDWHVSAESDAATTNMHIFVMVNGSKVLSSEMHSLAKFPNEPINISGTTVILVEKGDVITLAFSTDRNGDGITFEHITTTITEFFD